MSAKTGMDAFERMVERVLAYRPKKARNKQKKRTAKTAKTLRKAKG